MVIRPIWWYRWLWCFTIWIRHCYEETDSWQWWAPARSLSTAVPFISLTEGLVEGSLQGVPLSENPSATSLLCFWLLARFLAITTSQLCTHSHRVKHHAQCLWLLQVEATVFSCCIGKPAVGLDSLREDGEPDNFCLGEGARGSKCWCLSGDRQFGQDSYWAPSGSWSLAPIYPALQKWGHQEPKVLAGGCVGGREWTEALPLGKHSIHKRAQFCVYFWQK
jgi:hypothetical protein